MSIALTIALQAALLSPPVFERLPTNASGPINCPPPPATIMTVDGRIYECHPEEGESAYRDVTPPDSKTHWKLPFGDYNPPPYGTGSYQPAESWPFRAIVTIDNPGELSRTVFYVFDENGVILDSSKPETIGSQMMEVFVSGVRLWPTARVYYPLAPSTEKDRKKYLEALPE